MRVGRRLIIRVPVPVHSVCFTEAHPCVQGIVLVHEQGHALLHAVYLLLKATKLGILPLTLLLRKGVII